MNLRRILLTTCVLAASAAASQNAQAQCGYGGGFGGYGGYWDIGRLYGVLADNVPYYAAFPPVYYSYPVPRTYGYSPFAYPPGVMTPDVEVEPLMIDNPYIEGEPVVPAEPSSAKVDQTTSTTPATTTGPLVINNPYVTGATAKLAPASYASQR